MFGYFLDHLYPWPNVNMTTIGYQSVFEKHCTIHHCATLSIDLDSLQMVFYFMF